MIKMKREAKIGLFALLCMAGLYWGINWLRGQDLFRLNNTYYATYEQVNGLQKNASILVKGFKIGVVSDIKYDPSVTEEIIVELTIKSRYKIPENSQARIFSDGLLGGKAIEIIYGDSPVILKSGETLRSSQDKDLFEIAGSEIEFIMSKLTQLVDNITLTLANVNGVFDDNAQSLNATMNNLAQMSASLNSVVTGGRKDLSGLVSNLNTLSEALGRSAGGIENIVYNVEGITDSLRNTDFAGAAGSLTTALDNLNTTLDKVNEGDGSVGRLLNDESLYESLVVSVNNLGYLLEDLKENPGRYVSFSVFGGRKNK